MVVNDNKDLADHLREDKVEDADKDSAQEVPAAQEAPVVVLAVQEVPVVVLAAQEVPVLAEAAQEVPVALAQNAAVVQISSSLC